MTATGKYGGVLDRWAARFAERLMRGVSWHTRRTRSLTGAGNDRPWVLVLGREHYSERQQSYPLLRHRDLDKVIRGELAGEPATIFVPGTIDGDRRQVTFFSFDETVLDALPRSPIVIPESLLLETQLPTGGWADIERDDYRYFLFSNGRSQPAGGALGAPKLVAMAAGMDPEREPERWQGEAAVLPRLRRGLKSLQASTWWACRNPIAKPGGMLNIAWRPVGIAVAAATLGYLLLTTLYLQGSLSYREHALETLAPDVQEGLTADSEARRLADRQLALSDLWASRSDTQLLWAAVASAVRDGARITQIQLTDERVSIRGYAPDAAEVLTGLTEAPGFAGVNFDAPVRSDRQGRQNFALSFAIASPAAPETEADD